MKPKHLLLLLLALLGSTTLHAYNAYINGIYYNLLGNLGEVTCLYPNSTNNVQAYSGTVVIPESVAYKGKTYTIISIGQSAFGSCTGLTYVTIPNSVTTIDVAAFYGCGLTSIIIPNSVTSIGINAFCYCTSLHSVTIPNSVTEIGGGAFASTGLDSIAIPNSVTTIEDGTFCECQHLTSVNFGNGVTKIGNSAFSWCSGLQSITIPENVTSIDNNAFAYCYNLASITIPNSVSNIGQDAFLGCNKLTKVIVPDITAWCSISFGNNKANPLLYAKHIYSDETTEITDLVIPNGVTNIGSSTFQSCKSLTSVTIPNSVTSIGKSAFDSCSSLTSVTVGRGITDIGSNAFSYCSSLSNFYCCAKTAPDIRYESIYNPFYNSSIASATLHVPEEAIESYKNTWPWSDFGDIIPIKNTLTYIVDGEVYKTYEIGYDTPITPEEEPTKEGYTFSGWSEIPETMPARDVVVTGTFSVNQYTILFETNGGNLIESITQDYGSEITPPENPTKEGYTFIGWEPAIPETMPLNGLTVKAQWQINSYALIYIVDSEEYKTSTFVYGSEITPEEEPTKEGYTFSGWSEIPETMPAGDVVVTGSFTVNSYTLLYLVDGEEYKTSSVAYGTVLTPEPAPTKDGYTFSGWNGLPTTMPAYDVTVTGSFTVNNYTLTYKIDGNVYKTYTIAYGTVLTPEPAPTKDGYTFSEWNGLPTTMPAYDVTVTGSFTVNNYTLTYKVDGSVYKTYTIAYGTVLIPEPVPTKDGYTFSGWDGLPSTMPAHDVTVTGSFIFAPAPVDIVISSVGYATFYDSQYAYVLPNGLSAQVITNASNGKLTYRTIADGYASGIIPKGTAVMLASDGQTSDTYTLTASRSTATYTGTNLLHGSDDVTMTTGNGYHYKLSYGQTGTQWNDVFGWYWGAQDGTPFQIEGHKAWLVVPNGGTRAEGYTVDGEATEIIDTTSGDAEADVYYDIHGRRIGTPTHRGLYIRTGKKVVIK